MKRRKAFFLLISNLALITSVVISTAGERSPAAKAFGLVPSGLTLADVLASIARSKDNGEKPKDYLSERTKQRIIQTFAAKDKKLEIYKPLQPFVVPGQGIVFVYEVKCSLRREGKEIMVDAVMYFPGVISSKEGNISIKRAKAIPMNRYRNLMDMVEEKRLRLLMMLFHDNYKGGNLGISVKY